MEEKELKIDTPSGYEIDREKSTFEKIIFKKVKNFHPKTWEEYHNLTKGEDCCNIDDDDCVRLGYADEFSSKKRKEQYVALGKLLQLRDYWVKDYEFEDAIRININKEGVIVTTECGINDGVLTFPTREIANEFIDCFKNLLYDAMPLV